MTIAKTDCVFIADALLIVRLGIMYLCSRPCIKHALNKQLPFVMVMVSRSPRLECDVCSNKKHCKNCKIEMMLCCNCYEECEFNIEEFNEKK
jgi:hypothetical protein